MISFKTNTQDKSRMLNGMHDELKINSESAPSSRLLDPPSIIFNSTIGTITYVQI